MSVQLILILYFRCPIEELFTYSNKKPSLRIRGQNFEVLHNGEGDRAVDVGEDVVEVLGAFAAQDAGGQSAIHQTEDEQFVGAGEMAGRYGGQLLGRAGVDESFGLQRRGAVFAVNQSFVPRGRVGDDVVDHGAKVTRFHRQANHSHRFCVREDVMYTLDRAVVDGALSYPDYHALIERLLAEGKTTGSDHSVTMVDYTRLNHARATRLDKTLVLTDDLKAAAEAIDKPMLWLAIAEWWCGDVAQNIPLWAKLAALNPKIDFRLVLRDEHPALMDQFLTHGGRAIPIVLCADPETLQVRTHWGPRPKTAQEMVMAYKAAPHKPYKEFAKDLHAWYAEDGCRTLQAELVGVLKAWNG